MKLNKDAVRNLLVELGFTNIQDWSDEKLKSKLLQIPDKVSPEEVPEEFASTYDKIVDATEDGEIEFTSEIDVEEMDARALKSLIEERGLEVRIKGLDLEDLRAAVTRALKKAPPVDEEGPVKKEVKGKVKSDLGDDGEDDARPKKASNRLGPWAGKPKNHFGAVVGTIAAQITDALSEEWRDEKEVFRLANLPREKTRHRLYKYVADGLVQKRSKTQYRITPKDS